MPAKLKIATTPWDWHASSNLESLCQQAETVEAMGLHSLWLPENHFRGRYSVPAPLLLLAAVAARTRRIKLGCVSYLLPIRNPLLAAEEVAVLDQLSEGRLILGLGRGIEPSMFAAFGVSSSDKRSLFARHLDVMRQAWRGEPVAGSAGLSPLPRQSPHPPLWVAALGPKALRQVAGLGLPYLASPMEPLAKLQDNYQRFHQHVAEAGLAAVSTVPVMRTVFIAASDSQARDIRSALEQQLPASLRERAGPATGWAILGSESYVQEELCRYREQLSLSHLIVRAGLPGVEDKEEVDSLARLLQLDL